MTKKIKTYKAKSLFSGKVIDRAGMFVAVPDMFKDYKIDVIYEGEHMIIDNWHQAEAYRRFDDKFIKGKKYVLGYFEWKPINVLEQMITEDMLR